METIMARIADAEEKLRIAVDPGEHSTGIGMLMLTVAQLLEVVKQQEERDQKVARALDELAGKISFLSTSPTEVRNQVQTIARIIRGENEKGA